MRWPFYKVTDRGQSMAFAGIEIDPNALRCGCDPDVVGLNLAAVRRVTRRPFPPRRFVVSDPAMVTAIRDRITANGKLSGSSAFVARMDDLGAQRRAGKQALASIAALKDLLK